MQFNLNIEKNTPIHTHDGETAELLEDVLHQIETDKNSTPDIFLNPRLFSLVTNKLESPNNSLFIDLLSDNITGYSFPIKFDTGVFCGTDYISGYAFFGKTALIEKTHNEISDFVIQNTSMISDESCNFNMRLWDFQDGNSLIMVHYDSYLDYDLYHLISDKDIISIPFGAHVDDLTLDYMLSTIVYQWLAQEDSEDFIGEDADAYCYVTFNNKPYSEQQKELFIHLSKAFFCDIMKWHEIEDKNIIEKYGLNLYVKIAKIVNNFSF